LTATTATRELGAISSATLPLVADGGVIAFHDIVPRADKSLYMGVPEFWSEIRVDDWYDADEIVRPANKGIGGIGILVKDEEN